jgi:hypothetical protein
VQVGCTINYARTCLWKQTEESACVDYPGNVGENDLSTSLGSTSLNPGLSGVRLFAFNRGPVAQLGARFHGMEEVVGSIPTRSTKSLNTPFVRRWRFHDVEMQPEPGQIG